MQEPVRERVQRLREEVATIQKETQPYLNRKRSLHPAVADSENERRVQRLEAILEELRTLTEWKKP